MMKQTSTFAKVFSWGFALLWLVVCLLPFTQLISVTFSTADRGIVSTFYPNSLASGMEKHQAGADPDQHDPLHRSDPALCERDHCGHAAGFVAGGI